VVFFRSALKTFWSNLTRKEVFKFDFDCRILSSSAILPEFEFAVVDAVACDGLIESFPETKNVAAATAIFNNETDLQIWVVMAAPA
jgi:hypothetical protein